MTNTTKFRVGPLDHLELLDKLNLKIEALLAELHTARKRIVSLEAELRVYKRMEARGEIPPKDPYNDQQEMDL